MTRGLTSGVKPTAANLSTVIHIFKTLESVEDGLEKSLTKTLVFQFQSGDERLFEAYHEAQWVYNQTIQLATNGMDWDNISFRLENEADLVKSTTQRVVTNRWMRFSNPSTEESEPEFMK